jgi:segregation and condensation protein A
MVEVCEAEGYRVQLEVFEGPLDLLLHLIRQQEIDIYDIPIAQVTDQYLGYLRLMENLSISVAGEFLVMAANLIYIKSKLLLPSEPSPDPEEETQDPRMPLVQQLLEHERFKKAADLLHDRESVELAVWPRGDDEFYEEEKEAVVVNVFDLVGAFRQVLERFQDQIVLHVEQEVVSLEQKLSELRLLIRVHKEFLFSIFLKERVSRLNLVMTFMALLELARLGEVRLRQPALADDIRILAC